VPLHRVHEEGAAYTVPVNAIAPGAGYLDGNMTFAFPKDVATITVNVTKFAAGGAGLVANFSMGDFYQQPGGKGPMHTITEGTIDIKITP